MMSDPLKTVTENTVIARPRCRLLLQTFQLCNSSFERAATLQHVREYRANDSERTSPKESAEEPRDEDRLYILSCSDCKVKDREAEGRYDQRVSASVQL